MNADTTIEIKLSKLLGEGGQGLKSLQLYYFGKQTLQKWFMESKLLCLMTNEEMPSIKQMILKTYSNKFKAHMDI